jgi:hypothetical protein
VLHLRRQSHPRRVLKLHMVIRSDTPFFLPTDFEIQCSVFTTYTIGGAALELRGVSCRSSVLGSATQSSDLSPELAIFNLGLTRENLPIPPRTQRCHLSTAHHQAATPLSPAPGSSQTSGPAEPPSSIPLARSLLSGLRISGIARCFILASRLTH